MLTKDITLLVHQGVTDVVGVAGQKSQLVLHAEYIGLAADSCPLQRLVNLLSVISLGGIAPVRMHQTIDTEVAIVGVVAEVTTISPGL